MAETASRGRATPAARDSGREAPGLAPLRVRYFRRMKPNHVYPWEVTWNAERKGADHEVTVRLILPGAQVAPPEQTMNAGDRQAKAVFHVTPIAKGWLRGQRLEVILGGRKVQEIPLASHAIGQGRTWFLLFLTLFIPWFLGAYCHFAPARGQVDIKEGLPVNKTVYNAARELVPAPEFVRDISEDAHDFLKRDAPVYVGSFYEVMSGIIREQKWVFWSFWLFLLLTLVSAFVRRPIRRTALGRPIPLSA